MGNAAMRCVLHGTPTVRVMRTDGKIVEYDQPVLAAKVMRQHVDHLLVHCTPVDKILGATGQRRSKLTIMRSDQVLVLGQAYLLYPIPPQYRSSLVKSQCCLLSAEEADGSDDDGRLVRGSFRGLALRLRNQRKNLSLLAHGARKVGHTKEEAGSPLLNVERPSQSFAMEESDNEDNSSFVDDSSVRSFHDSPPSVCITRTSQQLVSGQA